MLVVRAGLQQHQEQPTQHSRDAAATAAAPAWLHACSARSDQYDAAKRELLQHVVESFRLR